MRLDPSRSRVAVYTFAEGLLSALAHDLELLAGEITGEADGETAELRVAVASLRVSGVVKRGKVDPAVLSAGDREAIERQIREDVLAGAEVKARGSREGSRASIEIAAPRATARVTCPVTVEDEPGGARRVRGRVDVSLAALKSPPVKGPMGAFRVKDAVRVDFDVVFA